MSQKEVDRREVHVDDDPKLLSPPVVAEPLYRCATVVQILGGVAGARIDVEVNGAAAGSGMVHAVVPYGITVGVGELKTGDTVRARQTTAIAQSGWSAPAVTVRDHTNEPARQRTAYRFAIEHERP